MDSKNIDLREDQRCALNFLFGWFDIFVSSDIEEEKADSCGIKCLSNCSDGPDLYIDNLIGWSVEYPEAISIIGQAELQALFELKKRLSVLDVFSYFSDDEKKGFSKTQEWLDFVSFVNEINVILKNAVERYEAKDNR